MPQYGGGAQEGTESDIEELQMKIQTLESERKTTFEQTQMLIRQNRDALTRGKMENRELRIALAQIQKDAGAAGTEDAESSKLTDLCSELRKCYDDLRNDAAEKCDELEDLADGLKDLELESQKSNQGDSPVTRQIRTLENRLDKAMIKYNEAQSIRRTYEQIVKRLKEERIGFDGQLAAVERTLKAKDHDLEELTLMLHDATHSKEQAKGELARLEDQLLEERKHRDEELKAKRKIAEQRAEMAKRLAEREQKREDIQKEAAGDLDAEGEDQLKESVITNVMHHNLNKKTLEEEEEQIDRYEEAFRKIKDATGVSDINEVIMKVISQEDTLKGLLQMSDEADAKLTSLTEEKSDWEKKIEEIKYASSSAAGSRSVVHGFETQLAHSGARAERAQRKYKEVHDKFIHTMSGVEHLCEKLAEVKMDTPAIPLSEDTVVDVLAQCEQKLKMLMKGGSTIRDLMAGGQGGEDGRPGSAVREHNVRVKIEENDMNDDLPLDNEDDGVDDEVMDREDVKRNSTSIVDKSKKKRGTKGSKSGARRGMDYN
jgi:chromosome segregation ATPase|eukprot:COSAG01_NODE_2745_length_7150_cov_3.617643_6_plen_544_part_00